MLLAQSNWQRGQLLELSALFPFPAATCRSRSFDRTPPPVFSRFLLFSFFLLITTYTTGLPCVTNVLTTAPREPVRHNWPRITERCETANLGVHILDTGYPTFGVPPHVRAQHTQQFRFVRR